MHLSSIPTPNNKNMQVINAAADFHFFFGNRRTIFCVASSRYTQNWEANRAAPHSDPFRIQCLRSIFARWKYTHRFKLMQPKCIQTKHIRLYQQQIKSVTRHWNRSLHSADSISRALRSRTASIDLSLSNFRGFFLVFPIFQRVERAHRTPLFAYFHSSRRAIVFASTVARTRFEM